MRLAWFIVIITELYGCNSTWLAHQPANVDPSWRSVYLPDLASSFVIPLDWRTNQGQQSMVFHGPEHSDLLFTTMNVQWGSSGDVSLDGALHGAFSLLDDHGNPNFSYVDPANFAGRLALAYTVQFTWQEIKRRQTGFLIPLQQTNWLHLSYGAPEQLFASGLHAFMALQESWDWPQDLPALQMLHPSAANPLP